MKDIKELLSKYNPFKSVSEAEEKEGFSVPKDLGEFETSIKQFEKDLQNPDQKKWPSDIDLELTKKFLYACKPTSLETNMLWGDLLKKIDQLLEELDKKSRELSTTSPEKSPPLSFGGKVEMSRRMKHNLDSNKTDPSNNPT